MKQESGGDPLVISPTGCTGLMQFCYGTAQPYQDGTAGIVAFTNLQKCCQEASGESYLCEQEMAACGGSRWCSAGYTCSPTNDDRLDPASSIKAGTHLLRTLFDQYQNIPLMAVAYNAGSPCASAIQARTGSQPTSQDVINSLDVCSSLGQVKLDEIREYVPNVEQNYNSFGAVIA